MDVLRKISNAVSEMGPAPALFYGLNRVAEWLNIGPRFYYYYLFAQPVAEKSILPASLGRTICIRQLVEDDPELACMPVTQEVISSRFSQSAICLGAFKGAELVAYLWLCPGDFEEDEVRCRFVPLPTGKSVWDFDVYVFPQHRVGLAFARLWDGANKYLKKCDVSMTYSRVSAFNSASRNSHQKLNARKVGTAVFFAVGRIQLTFTTKPPYIHLSAKVSSRPTIKLSAVPSSGALE